jgi:hypothetical protein
MVDTTRVEVVEEITVKVEVFRGPQGADGKDGAGVSQNKITIAAAATGVADSIPIVSGPAAKWLLTITDNVTGDQTLSEIWAGNDGTLVAHTRYGINSIGAAVPHTVDVVILAGSMELRVTNTGGNTVTSRAVRILTSA